MNLYIWVKVNYWFKIFHIINSKEYRETLGGFYNTRYIGSYYYYYWVGKRVMREGKGEEEGEDGKDFNNWFKRRAKRLPGEGGNQNNRL